MILAETINGSLKSNMDRFIDSVNLSNTAEDFSLKSNMDRFIDCLNGFVTVKFLV